MEGCFEFHEESPGRLSGGNPASPGKKVRAESILIGILAYQGDFHLHERAFERLGVKTRRVRLPEDLSGLWGLVIPGGESTTMEKLAQKYGIFPRLKELGEKGLPLFGTCAGAILLGQGDPKPPRLGLVPVRVHRNAYGRQRESFKREIRLDLNGEKLLCIFIRAPRIELLTGQEIEVLGRIGDDPILIRYRNILLATFHPELTSDLRIHRLFLDMCEARQPA